MLLKHYPYTKLALLTDWLISAKSKNHFSKWMKTCNFIMTWTNWRRTHLEKPVLGLETHPRHFFPFSSSSNFRSSWLSPLPKYLTHHKHITNTITIITVLTSYWLRPRPLSKSNIHQCSELGDYEAWVQYKAQKHINTNYYHRMAWQYLQSDWLI